MVNNKKSKTSSAKAKKGAAPAPPAPVATVPTEPATSPAANLATSGFPQSQFTGIIFIAVGISYLMEYHKVLETGDCAKYLANAAGDIADCTATDRSMIRTKFHSGLLAETLVALTMLLCWKDAPLFTRLNSLLVSSPLITTLLAMQTTKEIVHPGHLLKLGCHVTILLLVAASSIYYGGHAVASRRRWTIDLPNATLFTVGIAHAWEVYKFLSAGVFGYLAPLPVGAEFVDDAAAAAAASSSVVSIALLPYLAVDQSTICSICLFGAVYLDDNRKRTLLFFLAAIQGVALFYHLPQMEDQLLDSSYYENFYKGTTIFCLTAAFAPDVTLLTEPDVLFHASSIISDQAEQGKDEGATRSKND